jgi:uncharacterized protein
MRLARIIILPLLAAAIGLPAFAQNDQASVTARMKERVAQVDQLKVAGAVGENNQGFLEQRGALDEAQTAVMTAENTDRRTLYGILGSRLGITPALVGQQRAEQLRNASKPGVWLQAPDGSWYKK